MFAKGFATVPAKGMQEIPNQLAGRLPEDAIRLNTPATAVDRHGVTLASGEHIEGDCVVVATDAETASRLVPGLPVPKVRWRSVVGMNFAADESPLNEAIIALNGGSNGLINNVCVPSDVSSCYAPPGKACAVSVLGHQQEEFFEERLRQELALWFGEKVNKWRLLRSYTIRKALPEESPSKSPSRVGPKVYEGISFCCDYLASASIEGAIRSGLACAEELLSR